MYSVVLPVVDEVDSLRRLLPYLLHPGCEVIVCDNGSTDGSVRLVEDAIPNFNIRLLKGTGTVTDAILRGIREAYYEDVVVMDSDGSHPPEFVGRLAMSLDGKDMVIGSRYIKNGSSKDTLKNKLISKLFNLMTYFLAPKVKDRASGFWAIKKSKFDYSIRNTVKPMLECLVRGKLTNVVEVPYTFEPRVLGRTKHNRSTLVLKTFWDIFLLYMVKFRILNYIVVGGIGTIINLSIYYPLTLLFQQKVTFLGQVFYLPPFIVSSFLAGNFQYFMSRHWTFGDRREARLGFLQFWVMMSPTTLLDMVVIFLLVQFLHLTPIVAAITAILAVFMVRYNVANKWIWRHKK